MIALSYLTNKFFEELIDTPLEEKKIEHLTNILKNKMFFFIGNKENYRKIEIKTFTQTKI